MNTQEFIATLKSKLRTLPKQEVSERISFYLEIIDDGIEEGLSENEAIARIGNVEELATQILSERKKDANDSDGTEKRKLTAFEWALIIVGSPIWLPIFITALALVACGYAIVWALLITVWAIEAPFFAFAYISKYLLVFCKKATKCTLSFSKVAFKRFFDLFKGGDKK